MAALTPSRDSGCWDVNGYFLRPRMDVHLDGIDNSSAGGTFWP